jgi:hypothetical protein
MDAGFPVGYSIFLAYDTSHALRDEEGTNIPILRRIWIRFQGASMGAYSLSVPIDATGENGFKDKQDWYICFFFVPKYNATQ